MGDRLGGSDAEREARGFLRSPVVAAAVLGLAGTLTGIAVTALNNWGDFRLERQKYESSDRLERQKQESSTVLERQKYESSVILRTIENAGGNNLALATNLLFLINAKLISDPEGFMRRHLEQQQRSLNALAGTAGSGSAPSTPCNTGASAQ